MLTSRWKFHGEDGQGLVEYALIIVLIAVVVVTALGVFGVTLSSTFSMIAGHF